jgi:hypothetical protein
MLSLQAGCLGLLPLKIRFGPNLAKPLLNFIDLASRSQ